MNPRGRGRRAYAAGIGPKRAWQTQNGIRYRTRRVIVKARVSKLRGGGSRAAYAHLKDLQQDGSGLPATGSRVGPNEIERTTDGEDGRAIGSSGHPNGNEVERERSGRLYDAVSNEVDDRGFLERTE